MSAESEERSVALRIVETLREAGFESVWAGGCVRDELLERIPNDYDVATDASPDQIREVFGKRDTLPIGAAFGVITVIDRKSRFQIEVATFRSDSEYSDGRRPDSVSFSDMQEDALRRDFTINGLFYDPIAEKVIDFVGGQEDLQRQVVRAIGDPHQRIREDKLRMLRAVRIAANFEFELEERTRFALIDHAAEIGIVSAERIATEMRRMLIHQNRSTAMKLLRETDLLEQILPESKKLDQSEFEILLRQLDSMNQFVAEEHANDRFVVSLALLLLSLTSDVKNWQAICNRWRLSNQDKARAIWLAGNVDAIINANERPWPQIQRILIETDAELLFRMSQIIQQVSRSDAGTQVIEFCRERLAWPPEKLNPEPLVDGNELIQAGIKPGTQFSTLLRECRDAQLNGEIRTKEEALLLAQKLLAD